MHQLEFNADLVTDRTVSTPEVPLVPDVPIPNSASIAPLSLRLPDVHPRTHNIPVAMIHLRSPSPALLSLFLHFMLHAAYGLGIPVSRAASLPTARSLHTVLKSPFVHKKSQENFEQKVHKRAVKVWDADGEVVSKLVKYLEHNALAGVGMRVTRWERAEVGFGEAQMKHIKAESAASTRTTSDKVRALADSIVKQASKTAASSQPASTTSAGTSDSPAA